MLKEERSLGYSEHFDRMLAADGVAKNTEATEPTEKLATIARLNRLRKDWGLIECSLFVEDAGAVIFDYSPLILLHLQIVVSKRITLLSPDNIMIMVL
jgi:hypothetical protein